MQKPGGRHRILLDSSIKERNSQLPGCVGRAGLRYEKEFLSWEKRNKESDMGTE